MITFCIYIHVTEQPVPYSRSCFDITNFVFVPWWHKHLWSWAVGEVKCVSSIPTPYRSQHDMVSDNESENSANMAMLGLLSLRHCGVKEKFRRRHDRYRYEPSQSMTTLATLIQHLEIPHATNCAVRFTKAVANSFPRDDIFGMQHTYCKSSHGQLPANNKLPNTFVIQIITILLNKRNYWNQAMASRLQHTLIALMFQLNINFQSKETLNRAGWKTCAVPPTKWILVFCNSPLSARTDYRVMTNAELTWHWQPRRGRKVAPSPRFHLSLPLATPHDAQP